MVLTNEQIDYCVEQMVDVVEKRGYQEMLIKLLNLQVDDFFEPTPRESQES